MWPRTGIVARGDGRGGTALPVLEGEGPRAAGTAPLGSLGSLGSVPWASSSSYVRSSPPSRRRRALSLRARP
ncbi:hypothetical protein GCM10022384_33920 [Streptomyces marokkonensis]|uniref:Uncharacterized protein n=1 Tax=Streptomyces marokkonensis TaxID=324855 RepID=A0ABP7QGK2_9ACTN